MIDSNSGAGKMQCEPRISSANKQENLEPGQDEDLLKRQTSSKESRSWKQRKKAGKSRSRKRRETVKTEGVLRDLITNAICDSFLHREYYWDNET